MNRERLFARLRATFVEELDEQLRAADGHLLALERAPADAGELRALFRVMHTLKGAARAAAVPDAEAACHAAEALLATVRDASRPLAPAEVASLFATADVLRALQQSMAGELGVGDAVEAPAAAAAAVVPDSLELATPQPARAQESVRVASDRLDSLLTATNRLIISAGRGATDAEEAEALFTLLRTARAQWAQLYRTVRSQRGEDAQSGALTRQFAKLDEGMRELAGRSSRLADATAGTARELDVVALELSSGVRGLRQRPFESALDGLARMVRDIAAGSGKQVRLETSGAQLEADRGVLEPLREAVLHLVRNAVDHGIEQPEARRALGKPEEGVVHVEAAVGAGRMIVVVRDDGRGIDVAAVRRALERRGETVDGDDRAVVTRLLEGGISTRQAATDISGRGVGLDAAREAVQRVGGDLRFDWTAGRGTTFTIDVPVTMATLRAVLMRVGTSIVACPTAFVVRMLRVPLADLVVSEGRPAIATAAGPVLLASLSSVLGLPASPEGDGMTTAVILDDATGRRIAIRVDALLDESDVVVRPIRAQGEQPARHISGAALLPNGEIALVLNVGAVITDAAGRADVSTSAAVARSAGAVRRRVIVADDSITTRTLEQSVLEAAGYEVMTGFDGAEGWRLLQEFGADIVVADVEMPRMTGLEFCRAIRSSPRFANLPVILITGLESPEDRMRGLEAGADAYLGKSSFEQAALVDVVRDLLGSHGRETADSRPGR
ncbi:MAG: CheA signal transduction histidine kinase [Gemmatimonadetes bacterium]|nr:CheA signal transduction histidine kinase [Gemmatimonadota bacterium]